MASITGGSAILEKHREAIERDGPRMVTQAVGKNTFYGGSVKPDRDDKQSSSPNSYFQTGYKSLMDLAIRRILVVVATPEVCERPSMVTLSVVEVITRRRAVR